MQTIPKVGICLDLDLDQVLVLDLDLDQDQVLVLVLVLILVLGLGLGLGLRFVSTTLEGLQFLIRGLLQAPHCGEARRQVYIHSGISLNSGGILESLPPKSPEYKDRSSKVLRDFV